MSLIQPLHQFKPITEHIRPILGLIGFLLEYAELL